MAQAKKYETLVAQAEKAVASVKDPELKRAAFEKVLDDLLATDAVAQQEAKPRGRKDVAPKRQPREKRARGPSGYLQELIDDGFFRKPKTISHVRAELGNRGHHIPLTSLSGPLQSLCKRRHLRRHKAKTTGNKQTYNYSEW
jgi:hypothetical protein